jgi:DNA-binding FadR family transcriptional regulator
VAALREQLEVARSLGLVEVKPRTGMRRKPYSFAPAVLQSLDYAIALNKDHFLAFADLRQHVETAYWHQAVKLLTPEDHETLNSLLRAHGKNCAATPSKSPTPNIANCISPSTAAWDNPFVTGLLQSYWDAYETVGLNFFTDYNYLTQVWTYHQKMVDAICMPMMWRRVTKPSPNIPI